MKATIFVLCCCLLAVAAFAQNQEIDSLEKALKGSALRDTDIINAYNNLAFDYAYLDPQHGVQYADKSIALCKKLGDNLKLGTAYNYKAMNYANLGNDSLAIYWYNTSIKLAQSTGNRSGEGKAMNNLAILYTNRAEYKKALELRLTALAIFRELHNQKAMGSLLNNLGVSYLYLSNYPQALSSYFQALEAAQQMNDQNGQARALMNIGLVYKKLGKYDNTFHYYEKALNIYKGLGDEQQMAQILANMGSAYDERGAHQKALILFSQALAINRKNKLKREQGSNLTDIGIVYSNLKQYSNAYHTLQQALRLYKGSPDDNSLAVIYNELAEMIVDVPDSALTHFCVSPANRYAEARKYALNGISVSRESESQEREMAAWQLLSTIDERLKNYNEALTDYKKYTALKDSIFNDEKKIAITKAELRFEADKQQALALAAVQREKIIKNALAVICVIVLFASLALFVFYKRRRDAIQAQKDLVYASKVTDTEMKVLRLQMNPHFIFNSLNSVSNYISKNDTKNAAYFLDNFASLMRKTLESSEEREISLADELKMTGLYMQLEAARLNQKFTYDIVVDDNIAAENVLLPPLILQPFVENSIWHGIAPKQGNGHIKLEAIRDGELLHLAVTDNGIGRQHKINTGRRSFGVKITADRLALLNYSKQPDMGIAITDLEQGTRVSIKLPYKTDTDI
jgi:tetratricopeptide (TPR) repeat protein